MKSSTPNMVMDQTTAHAVATGISPETSVVRKGRVRKSVGTPRKVAIEKKKKEPKAPRNPFRRSETVKLQLKNLQMGKRVETMAPRVDLLRNRLDLMQKRLDFLSGKWKLVKEELAARIVEAGECCESDGGCTTTKDDVMGSESGVNCVDAVSHGGESQDDVGLHDETEDVVL
jgi:hypothetical protein